MSPNLDALRHRLLSLPASQETYPFGPEVMVFKVADKMFALLAWQENPLRLSVKAEPQQVLWWQQCYPQIGPGYHLNKRHWLTAQLDEALPWETICRLMGDSYALVVAGLPKGRRQALQAASRPDGC
ncbi:MmcQ/YjbR family DNA-binding protein [Pseudaeromonas paramecii]|uniref:MmcQ/YjbR family DNA-binding protein n=1 Tax=Pseudaeromonas paramecii TaxID=2138166 RepID=A0ABP8Q1F2_9GAMM